MKKTPIPLFSIVLVIIGMILIGLFVFDKADTTIGVCGMILCSLAAAIRVRSIARNRSS